MKDGTRVKFRDQPGTITGSWHEGHDNHGYYVKLDNGVEKFVHTNNPRLEKLPEEPK